LQVGIAGGTQNPKGRPESTKGGMERGIWSEGPPKLKKRRTQ